MQFFMFNDFLIPFLVVGLAELGDKTQIAILIIASKTKNHISLLLGIVIAFIITNGFSILLGNYVTTLFDLKYIKIVSGLIFIIFGIFSFLEKKEDEEVKDYEIKNPFITGFLLIFVLEMGDKTQIMSGLLATKYNFILVFLGVVLSLTLLSILAIYLGKILRGKIHRKLLSISSGIIFILIGLLTIIGI